ncbi:hypothetical protein IFM89_019122 [Coptis chinensis]|uniref:Uncharacterized protein n=1 Tax=Coptis chinensis TaxID=261450 RepID=A0A835HYU6_9MAGN|nr:hypothetical protein IFM89_019122 [Coptis chinensis]
MDGAIFEGKIAIATKSGVNDLNTINVSTLAWQSRLVLVNIAGLKTKAQGKLIRFIPRVRCVDLKGGNAKHEASTFGYHLDIRYWVKLLNIHRLINSRRFSPLQIRATEETSGFVEVGEVFLDIKEKGYNKNSLLSTLDPMAMFYIDTGPKPPTMQLYVASRAEAGNVHIHGAFALFYFSLLLMTHLTWSRGTLSGPNGLCCNSRDELDAVCSAISNLPYISLASLKSRNRPLSGHKEFITKPFVGPLHAMLALLVVREHLDVDKMVMVAQVQFTGAYSFSCQVLDNLHHKG